MQLDVTELRDFYATRLGHIARRIIVQEIRATWPEGNGQRLAAMGYCTPFLRPFLKEATSVTALMPAGQGVIIWPREGPFRTALIDEYNFPVHDEIFDRVLEVHGLELFADPAEHLKEVWRALKPEGRLLLIVPNRRGVWARFDTTPFGHGQPYSAGQLEKLLKNCWFRPLTIKPLLHIAPFDKPWRLTANPAFERMGARLWPAFSGMLMVEAAKDVAQPIRAKPAKARKAVPNAIRAEPVPV